MSKFLNSEELNNLNQNFNILKTLPNTAKTSNFKLSHIYKEFKGLNYIGKLDLLKAPKIAIIGSRTPNQYAKIFTAQLAKELNNKGFVIISGGAIGIDCIAHSNSLSNTIMCSPAGLNINYPSQNTQMIEYIKENGLILSEYEDNFRPYRNSFLERNRIIVALSDIVIIPYADVKSGSSSSANLAILLNKEIYTLPHRINESIATNELLETNKARAIYNIYNFSSELSMRFLNNQSQTVLEDELLIFASLNGSYNEALNTFGDKVFIYELEGKIKRVGLNITLP